MSVEDFQWRPARLGDCADRDRRSGSGRWSDRAWRGAFASLERAGEHDVKPATQKSVMSSVSNSATHAPAVPAISASPVGLLQRQCACGDHTMAGGECEECKKKEMLLQRQAMGPSRPA